MRKELLIIFAVFLLILPISFADTIPYTDWDYKCTYNLKNVTNLSVCNDARIGHNLFVGGNVSAGYYYGSGAFLNDLNVSGNLSFNGNMWTNLKMNGYNITGINYAFANYFIGGWFFGIYNWIIGATSTNYLSFNGTQLDFNETKMNATIKVIKVDNATYADSAGGILGDYYVNKSGDTMTGNLNMSGNNITEVGTSWINNLYVGIGTMVVPPNPLSVNGSAIIGTPGISFAGGINAISLGYNTFALGDYSLAFGYGASAGPASYTTAIGLNANASGEASVALGMETNSRGDQSTAMGYKTIAGGVYSTAIGQASYALGGISIAAGSYSNATDTSSVAIGEQVSSSGRASVALGYHTTADGDYSTATGHYTNALGTNSIAMGSNATANHIYSTVFGLTGNQCVSDTESQFKICGNLSASWITGMLNWSWLQNIPSYVIDWASVINSIGNWTADKPSYYNTTQTDAQIEAANTSMKGYVDVQDTVLNNMITSLGNWSLDKSGYYTKTDIDTLGNWSADKPNYYNSTHIDAQITAANASMKDYVDTQDALKLNTSEGTMTGNLTFYGNNTGLCFEINGNPCGGYIISNGTAIIFKVS